MPVGGTAAVVAAELFVVAAELFVTAAELFVVAAELFVVAARLVLPAVTCLCSWKPNTALSCAAFSALPLSQSHRAQAAFIRSCTHLFPSKQSPGMHSKDLTLPARLVSSAVWQGQIFFDTQAKE